MNHFNEFFGVCIVHLKQLSLEKNDIILDTDTNHVHFLIT